MTEKRFINDIDNGRLIDTKGELSTINYSDKVDFYELWEFLNKLNDENELLKQQIGNLEHTRDFCAERCERLEKENEELKFEIRKVQRAYEQLWEHTYK